MKNDPMIEEICNYLDNATDEELITVLNEGLDDEHRFMCENDFLFLDDVRNPEDVKWVNLPKGQWKIVRGFNAFVNAVEQYYISYQKLPSFISFDHDLAPEHYRQSMYNPDEHYSQYYTDGTFTEKTGYCCAKWLIEFCQKRNIDISSQISCHSMNPLGKKNILTLFKK